MKVILRIVEAEKLTIGQARAIMYALEKAGFQVEMQPTQINPVQYVVTRKD